MTITASPGGPFTVNAVRVLTSGITGLDFAAGASGNCAGNTFSTGQQCTQSVTFTPAYPGQRLGAVVLLDASNNVLGTTYLQGTGAGGLGLIIPGTIQTWAGDGDWKNVGDGLLATNTELFLPSALAMDGLGNLFIADSHHNRIRMVCSGTASNFPGVTCSQRDFIYTVANPAGNLGFAGDGLIATNASVALNTPSGLAIDGAGNLYIADTGNNRIRKITMPGGIISTIAGTGTQGFTGDGGAATSAAFNQPDGVAVDLNGNVFIADTGNSRIRAICAASGTTIFGVSCATAGNVVTVAGSINAAIGDGGQATAASLDNPYTIAFDAAWNLYIADSNHQRIRAVCAAPGNTIFGQTCSATGVILTVVGDGVKDFKGDGGAATSAEINSPSGLVLDPAGNLYVADTQNFRIRKVSSSTGIITTIAGDGSGTYGGDGGPATSAGIYGPYGLTLDSNGNLYIAVFLDNRVREVLSNLSVVTVKTPVRQGSQSSTTNITVENDGPATLTLTDIVPGTHAAVDPAVTTCFANGTLTVNSQCIVGAVFAPASSPTLTTNTVETGTINVDDQTVTGVVGSNSPLKIQITGTATPVNATTVMLTSTPNPSQFGQNVMFSAAVTTGANTGVLTGAVKFFDGATQLSSAITVDGSGNASFATTALTVGSHTITATYSGDSLHFGNTSDPLTQIVKEATRTTLVSSANPSAVGSPVTFTATVTPAAGGGVTPDGTVTFMDGSNALATVTLDASAVASYTTSTLSDGLHTITAVYSGDLANYLLGSTSAPLEQDVLAPSTVVVTSNLNPSNYGQAVTFTAIVTSSSTVAATGVVNFLDGGAQIGTANLVGTTGVATFTTSALTAGNHVITVSYKGSPNVGPGTSAAITQVVNLAPTSTVLSAAPTPGIAGLPVTLTAHVSLISGSATITGTVTFTDGTTALGTVNLGTNGTASISPMLAPGTHSIVATYSGDANDHTSASAPLPVTVILATTQVALTTSASPAQVLSPVTFTATVTGNGGIPTGTVTFNIDGATAGTGTLAAGVATFTTSSLGVGTHTVVAVYAGDTNDNGSSSSSLSQVIVPIPTATNLGTTNTGGTNPQSVLVATVLGATGPTPTGTVTFSIGSNVIGSATLNSSGIASLLPDLAPGTYNVVASYGGDAIHSPSTSAAVSITGKPAGFSITVDPPTLTVKTSQNGNINVTFTSDNGFADTIGTGCLSLPWGVNCHFSSDSVTLKSGQSQTVTLTVDTNSPLSGGSTASNARPGSGGLSLAGLFLPVSVFFGWILWRFRKRNPALLLGALILWVSGAFAVTGCGASFSQRTAIPGTYTIQVGGVGTGSNVSHYQSVKLTITK